MMNPEQLSTLRRLLIVFLLVSVFAVMGKSRLLENGVDWLVLLLGNFILFDAHLASYLISTRAIRSSNPQSFVRAMYLGFIIKFFCLAVAAFVYIMVVRKEVNKPALLALAGLYVVYTVLEVGALQRQLKKPEHA